MKTVSNTHGGTEVERAPSSGSGRQVVDSAPAPTFRAAAELGLARAHRDNERVPFESCGFYDDEGDSELFL